MKLVKAYNIPGGAIKIYQEAGEISARLTMSLIQLAPDKRTAMQGLAKQAEKLSNAVFECLESNKIDISQGAPVKANLKERQAAKGPDKNDVLEAKRQAWIASHSPMVVDHEPEFENPYND